MKTVLRRASNTVNAHLTALDHFFTQLGPGPAVVRRDDAPKLAPRALDARPQKRYLRAVERRPLARDRAIGRLLFYSGVRIAELVALDDVPLSARKGKVIVRSGKGETSREIPLLDGTARTSITGWRTDRASWPGADAPALFLNRRGAPTNSSASPVFACRSPSAASRENHQQPNESALTPWWRTRHPLSDQLAPLPAEARSFARTLGPDRGGAHLPAATSSESAQRRRGSSHQIEVSV
ncbi:tyrosine-type recombinase/integrase [Microbispora sp. NPDC046933]|uniref:site-specific integrase n=1 Tax=Microbispora sp. NPDC046933 TaxID=3155618 RepID=UPI0033FD2AAF